MKTWIFVSVAILAGFCGLADARTQTAAASPQALPERERQVFSDYLRGAFLSDQTVVQLVVADKTQSHFEDELLEAGDGKPFSWDQITDDLRKTNMQIAASSLTSFRDANAHPVALDRIDTLPVPYHLVAEADYEAIFKHGGGWKDYYKKYPGAQGFVTLSRAGFSADGKQALLYLANHCGGKCGAGTYAVLEKVGSSWKLIKATSIWMS
ncbi:MAG: hypothetical protein WA209_19025 [Candidatus Acidiferrales bacterium]